MNPTYRKKSTTRVLSDGSTEYEELEESFGPTDTSTSEYDSDAYDCYIRENSADYRTPPRPLPRRKRPQRVNDSSDWSKPKVPGNVPAPAPARMPSSNMSASLNSSAYSEDSSPEMPARMFPHLVRPPGKFPMAPADYMDAQQEQSYFIPQSYPLPRRKQVQESPMRVGRDLAMAGPHQQVLTPPPNVQSTFAPSYTSTPTKQRPQQGGNFFQDRLDALAASHQDEISDLHESYRSKLASCSYPGERQQIEEHYRSELQAKQHIHSIEMEALEYRIREANHTV